jgi:hypothetical protein
MIPSMAQPKLPSELVPEALKPLVEQLASLPEEQREAVIHAARCERSTLKLRAVPWDHLLAAVGKVNLGGDAIEDSRALYDG